jgi:hypothetical protein
MRFNKLYTIPNYINVLADASNASQYTRTTGGQLCGLDNPNWIPGAAQPLDLVSERRFRFEVVKHGKR